MKQQNKQTFLIIQQFTRKNMLWSVLVLNVPENPKLISYLSPYI